MLGISLTKRQWIWGIVAVIVAIVIITVVMFRSDDRRASPADHATPLAEKNIGHEADVTPPPPVAKKRQPDQQTDNLASQSPPATYSYPAEQENAFIEEAMETMPKLIEVEVHEPGVVFFRHEPDKPEFLEYAMEDLAERYKTILKYDRPVNVVFFISGRPAKARVFFRE